ncbi:MAG: tetratricopeptide repeat protein [Chthoniobacterales bacterium]
MKTEKDLPESHRPTWLKAVSAMELKNYGYVVQLMQSLLKQQPDFLPGRILARKAAVRKAATAKKGLFGSGGGSSSKAKSLIKKDPLEAMDAIEKVLGEDPHSASANQVLRDAALAADMPEIAAFALETIIDGNPKDVKTMHELAQHYIKHEQPEKAVDTYTKITDLNPADLVAVKGGKDAAARASMQRGGWENKDATYRDLIRDKDAAVSMEQQNRVVRSDEMIEQQLAELGRKYEENPESVDTTRKIAQLYEQKDDLENAVTWFTYAAGLTNNTDAALVRKASDLRVKQFDSSISQYETFIAENPESEEIPRYQEELADIKRQRAELALEEARQRVQRNPTDLMFRFELAEILINLGQYKEAVPELQKARQNPNVRLRAMNLLGKCFVERNMLDLAAKTLEDAAGELLTMDTTKKDIMYNLGLLYDKMGNREKSIDALKQIYEVDYGYRDVAERVEGSYEG